jgi:hypothetical protein
MYFAEVLSAQITSLFHNHSHTHLATLAKQYSTRAQILQEEIDKVKIQLSDEVIECVQEIIERQQWEEKAEAWLQ